MTNSMFRQDNSSSFFYRFVDLLILVVTLLSCLIAYSQSLTKDYLLILLAYLLCYAFVAESVQLYRSWRVGRFGRMLFLLIAVHTLCFLALLSTLFFLKQGASFSRVVLVGWYGLSILCLISWRVMAKEVKTLRRKKGLSMQRVAIIGYTETGRRLHQQIQEHIELGFDCVGFFDDRALNRLGEGAAPLIKGSVESAVMMAQQGRIQKLYICLPMLAEKRIADIIQRLGDSTVDVLMIPDFLLKNLMHARIGSVGEVDTLSVFESPVYGIKEFYKRAFDFLFSAAVLLLISPLMLAIAAAIKATSAGPVFFRQQRYGLDGKPINVLKFRSMRVMENGAKVTQATKDDPRITPIGAFLRRTSLDELPQFINVLLGDMSVVGPRPHASAHNEEYRKQVDYYMLRHKVRPGITGWAQINGWRGETDTLDKMAMRVKYDLEYIRQWSLWLDIKIIVLTLFKGFSGKNAY